MTYKIGQKVCLWEVGLNPDSNEVQVLKEVVVTITEIKTGVPSEFSREPVRAQSLRGLGDDGKTYEKHWEDWPESQTNDYNGQWSVREDGTAKGMHGFWIPREAIYVYNDVYRYWPRRKSTGPSLVDLDGQLIKPKGDFTHCEKHDRYSYEGDECFYCFANRKREALS